MIASFEGKTPQIPENAYLAPGSAVIGDVRLGEKVSVWFQSVLRGDINYIEIGAETNIQDGCLLHVTQVHPLHVGARVTVGHGVILHGCNIGDDCLIAMGAIVLDGAVVETGCLVGAGALIPPGMLVPQGSLVLGSPAKVVREVRPEDKERIAKGWQNYIDYAARFRSGLREI